MKKIPYIVIFILLITVFGLGFFILQNAFLNEDGDESIENEEIAVELEKPLNAYTFNALKQTTIPGKEIKFGEVVDETDEYIERVFYFQTPTKPNGNEFAKVSGLATIPKTEEDAPIIVMYRGFVPDDTFFSGAGTSPSARQLALSGYMTLAPDFLGFGESDEGALDSFENRFQTYTTSLSLLESLKSLDNALDDEYEGTLSADLENVGFWGHSNGGHITLVTLALTGKDNPTVLWAPVSKSFPYSILYYTDETDDQGQALRAALSEFENLYEASDFSPERYYRWIDAPILINQGTSDPEIPYWWSDELVETLENEELEIEYRKYPGANHNMQPGWDEAVLNTIEFYNSNMK